jgi:hypothetical protein
MVKPIPMKESRPSRITIAHAMWGRNYAYPSYVAGKIDRVGDLCCKTGSLSMGRTI